MKGVTAKFPHMMLGCSGWYAYCSEMRRAAIHQIKFVANLQRLHMQILVWKLNCSRHDGVSPEVSVLEILLRVYNSVKFSV